MASVGGNIATATPISDLNPIWVAAGVTLELQSLARTYLDINILFFNIIYHIIKLCIYIFVFFFYILCVN